MIKNRMPRFITETDCLIAIWVSSTIVPGHWLSSIIHTLIICSHSLFKYTQYVNYLWNDEFRVAWKNKACWYFKQFCVRRRWEVRIVLSATYLVTICVVSCCQKIDRCRQKIEWETKTMLLHRFLHLDLWEWFGEYDSQPTSTRKKSTRPLALYQSL